MTSSAGASSAGDPAHPPAAPAPAPARRYWLDWQRGLAVLFMVEVHVLDAWTVPGGRLGHERLYDALQFIGGLAAPGFLYMAGISQSLADQAAARRGAGPAARRSAAVDRGIWLLGVAYLFRIFSFVAGGAWGPGWGLPYVLGVDVLAVVGFGATLAVKLGAWHPRRPRLVLWGGLGLVLADFLWKGGWRWDGWQDVVKVDVLNVIAVGMVASAWLGIGRRRWVGVSLEAAAAVLAILATPWIAVWLGWRDQPEQLARLAAHPLERLLDVPLAYLHGRPPRSQFDLFNWIAFMLAGAAIAPLATGRSRPVALLSLAAALHLLGRAIDPLLRLPSVEPGFWWRESPSWFLTRLAICVAISGALQLVPGRAEPLLRWLSLLGRQSLPGYMVSVELTYGGAAAALARAVPMPWVVGLMVDMALATWVACRAWEWWTGRERRRAAASSAA